MVILETLQNIIIFLELAFQKVKLVMWKNQIGSTLYPLTRSNNSELLLYLGICEVSPHSQ